MVRLTNEVQQEDVFTYRERASINLSQLHANSLRLRILVEVEQSPLAPYTNLKFNPESTWYGTCTFLWQGYVINRVAIEPTYQVVFDQVNEHAFRRLDSFKDTVLQYEYNVSMGNFLQAWYPQWQSLFLYITQEQTDMNELFLLRDIQNRMERYAYCIYAQEDNPPDATLDAFPWAFDQLKFVFPPETQFKVRMQYWLASDTCDDTINDLLGGRTPEPNPNADGAADPYQKPRQSPGGGDPYNGLEGESPRVPENDPRDYANAPLPGVPNITCLRAVGTFFLADAVGGNRNVTIDKIIGCYEEPYSYAFEEVGVLSDGTGRKIYNLRVRNSAGQQLSNDTELTNYVSGNITFTRQAQ